MLRPDSLSVEGVTLMPRNYQLLSKLAISTVVNKLVKLGTQMVPELVHHCLTYVDRIKCRMTATKLKILHVAMSENVQKLLASRAAWLGHSNLSTQTLDRYLSAVDQQMDE